MKDQSSVPPAAVSAKPAPAKPRRRRRWPWILGGIVVLLLLLVALLPTILSTGPFRRMVLGKVNQQLNGKADIESWSLGWFSGFKLNGIRVTDAQGKTVVTVKSVTLPAGIPALLRSRKEIGTLEIEAPKAEIVLYADGTNNLMKLMKPAAAPPPAKEAQPLGFDLVGAIAVRNGEITVHATNDGKPFVVRDLSADVKIESLEKPIQLDLKAALGEERAPLTVKISAAALRDGKFDPTAVEATIAVSLTALDLAPLSTVARAYGAPVTAAGNLTATLNAEVKGQDSVSADGQVTLKQLSLSGGPLGKDQPKFDQVSLAFDVAKTGQAVTIQRFEFTSPVAGASVSGSLEPQAAGLPKGNLVAHATLALPALAAQLPDTLKLQQGLAIESGTVTLDSTLASDEKGRRVEGALRVEKLAAVRDGRHIALEAPITVVIKASQTEKGARLDNLEFTSSFATMTGSGTPDKFDLEVTSDLAAALREAGKFADLAGKTAQGRAKMALHFSSPAATERKISGDATLTDLALTGFTPGPVQLSDAKASLAATARMGATGELQEIRGLKIDLSAAKIADGAITADSIAFTPGQALPDLKNANAALNVNLGEAARLARGMGLMPAAAGLDGKFSVTAGLAVEKGAVRLPQIAAKVTGLVLTGFTPGPVQLSEAKVTLAATARVDSHGALQEISGLKIDLSAAKIADGAITADSVAFAPGQALPALTNANVSLNADLAEVARFAGGMNLMPAGTGLGGKLSANAALAADKGVIRLNPIAVTVTDLDVSQVGVLGDKPVTRHVREPKITLAGSADVNPAGRTAGIHDLTCQIAAGTLAVPSLEVPDWAAAPAGITATLKADLDLERLLASLKDFAPLPDDTKVTGAATFTLKATTAAATQRVALQAALNGLKVASGTGPAFEENKFTLDAAAVVTPGAASVTLDSLTVASSLVNLTAKGALNDWVKSRDLKADGTLQCNWDKIGALAAAFSAQPVEMSGNDSKDFHIRTQLGAKDLRTEIAKTDAVAAVQVARLKVMGIEMTGISALITVKDNVPSARIESSVNGGKLLIPARVDWSKLLPELVLPPDTVVLKDVKLTSEMADLGLSRVSPIFKGCTAAGGTVSLDSHLLDVQLGRAVSVGKSILKRASFEGGLTFNGISMQSSGVLQSVLQLTGNGAQLLSLPNQRVTLALRDGRVIQGPMEIAAGTYRFKVSGSVGLADKTMDYLVEAPVTAAMLGGRDDLYQLVKGEVISISIKGTSDNPQIGKDAFADNVKRLATTAAKKLVEQQGTKVIQQGVQKGLQNLFK